MGRNGLRIFVPLIITAVMITFISSVSDVEHLHSDKGKEELENSIRKASAACFAAEGIYPPDIDYLKEYYGVRIDDKRFIVKYNAFASNLMPDITVLDVAYE